MALDDVALSTAVSAVAWRTALRLAEGATNAAVTGAALNACARTQWRHAVAPRPSKKDSKHIISYHLKILSYNFYNPILCYNYNYRVQH